MSDEGGLRVEEHDGGWRLAGAAVCRFGLVNEYLGYLVDRRYSPRTVRAYAFDLTRLHTGPSAHNTASLSSNNASERRDRQR